MKTLAKWSVDDYHRMIAAGILRDRPVELLAGDIVEQMSASTGQSPYLTLNLNQTLPLCDRLNLPTMNVILTHKISFG
ncbi:MAG: hypothetical protein ACRAVC_08245 [Trichormus sp.]